MAKRSDPRMLKPYIMVGHRSEKGFNTTTVAVRPKCGAKVTKRAKSNVNCRRINKETMRHKLAVASFINAPRLMSGDTVVKVCGFTL